MTPPSLWWWRRRRRATCWATGCWGCLEKIATRPQYQRQGIAQAILGSFLRYGQEHLAFLTLEVREDNAPALALYEKNGFVQVGRRKNYYSEVHRDAILMTREFEGGET